MRAGSQSCGGFREVQKGKRRAAHDALVGGREKARRTPNPTPTRSGWLHVRQVNLAQ